MLQKIFLLVTSCILTILVSSCSPIPKNAPKTMPGVNLKRYMGNWYEIASLPAPFQKNCYCTMAQYKLDKSKVKVINSCRQNSVNGKLKVAHATAVTVPDSHNSKLKITFFWFIKANYWILYVSPNYETAVVGTPDHKYLWILSRHKTVSTNTYKKLRDIAIKCGYNLQHLHKTVQYL